MWDWLIGLLSNGIGFNNSASQNLTQVGTLLANTPNYDYFSDGFINTYRNKAFVLALALSVIVAILSIFMNMGRRGKWWKVLLSPAIYGETLLVGTLTPFIFWMIATLMGYLRQLIGTFMPTGNNPNQSIWDVILNGAALPLGMMQQFFNQAAAGILLLEALALIAATAVLPFLFIIAWPTRHLGRAGFLKDVVRWTLVAHLSTVVMLLCIVLTGWVFEAPEAMISGSGYFLTPISTLIMIVTVGVPFMLNKKFKDEKSMLGGFLNNSVMSLFGAVAVAEVASSGSAAASGSATRSREQFLDRARTARNREGDVKWLKEKFGAGDLASLATLHPSTRGLGLIGSAIRMTAGSKTGAAKK